MSDPPTPALVVLSHVDRRLDSPAVGGTGVELVGVSVAEQLTGVIALVD